MKVDVIIPAHNPGPYLREALNSVMAQTHRDWHIYVIDDASTEDIETIVKKYRKTTYLRLDKNAGPSGARNYGIAQSDSPLISFLDSDDIWDPRKLEFSIREFERKPHIGMTCGNYQRLVNRTSLCYPFYRRPIVIDHRRLMKQNFVASGSVTMRRDVFEDLGGFDEDLWIGEDAKLWLMCSEKYEIKYLHRVLYKYSVIESGNSLTNRADLQKSHEGALDIVRLESLERMNAIRLRAKSNDID
jgi:glycosyltransferase involved in cell wall biosynthesis